MVEQWLGFPGTVGTATACEASFYCPPARVPLQEHSIVLVRAHAGLTGVCLISRASWKQRTNRLLPNFCCGLTYGILT